MEGVEEGWMEKRKGGSEGGSGRGVREGVGKRWDI